VAITSAVTATKVAGSLFGSVPAANMPKYFPGRVAIATSREIFAPILWRVSHNQHFLRGNAEVRFNTASTFFIGMHPLVRRDRALRCAVSDRCSDPQGIDNLQPRFCGAVIGLCLENALEQSPAICPATILPGALRNGSPTATSPATSSVTAAAIVWLTSGWTPCPRICLGQRSAGVLSARNVARRVL
jgi:hypothetical protein